MSTLKYKRLFLFLSFLLIISLIGCSNKEIQPNDVFATYVKNWEKQDFDKMYDMHSSKAKETVNKEDFTKRYKKIYSDLEVKDLKITYKKPPKDEKVDKNTKSVTIPFTVSMNTIAGPIKFDQKAKLVKVDKDDQVDWQVNWNTGFIFAGMEPEDRISLDVKKASRGQILDRNGEGLAINGDVYEVGVVPEQLGDQADMIKEKLSKIIGTSVEKIDQALSADWVKPQYFVPIKKIPNSQSGIVSQLDGIPGVEVQKSSSREYLLAEAAAHLIGYVDEVSAEDIEKNEGYAPGDVIGKRGLEQLFEDQLKGENGIIIYIEKPDGTKMELAEKPLKNGKTIQLTIDSKIQKELVKQFNGRPGTAVAMNPKTGEVLALVSSPSFNPNEYMFLSASERKALDEKESEPLLNRFVYPHTPGSVMKPFTAGIALETGAITTDLSRDIKTKQWQKDSSWGGYYVTRVKDPGKPVNLRDALVFSDNIYFAQTALDVGAKKFTSEMKKFGFGEEIPFTYPLKASQISRDGNISNEILLADSGYGQGEVQTNIVQLAAGYTTFINDGNMIKPILLTSDEKAQVWKKGVVSAEHAKVIAEYLRDVVKDKAGTAHSANMEQLPLSGKTGTAEVGKTTQGKKAVENGWFVAYNTESPDLLIAMTMEGVEGGSKTVVKAVKEVFTSVKK